MPVLFLFSRRRDRPDLEIARVPFRGQALDDTALSGRVPPFEDDDRAAPVDDMSDLDAREPLLQRGQVRIIVAGVIGAAFEIVELDAHPQLRLA